MARAAPRACVWAASSCATERGAEGAMGDVNVCVLSGEAEVICR